MAKTAARRQRRRTLAGARKAARVPRFDQAPEGRRQQPGRPVFAAGPEYLLSCDQFICKRLEITKWIQPVTRDKVQSMKDSTGAVVPKPTPTTPSPKWDEVMDAMFKSDSDPTKDINLEKNFPKPYGQDFDTCPPHCTCPKTWTWGPEEEADQDLVHTVGIGAVTYSVKIKVKVRRKIGTAKCV